MQVFGLVRVGLVVEQVKHAQPELHARHQGENDALDLQCEPRPSTEPGWAE